LVISLKFSDQPHEGVIILSEDGYTFYEGSIINGVPWGFGTFTWEDGAMYEGQWENGTRQGFGKMTNLRSDPNGPDFYIGQWKNNNMHGKGKLVWNNEDFYVGDFENNTRTGNGTYTWEEGTEKEN